MSFKHCNIQAIKQYIVGKKKHAEVEFLQEINGQIIPIEAKSGWITRAKSLQTFVKKYKSPYRVIMNAHPLDMDLQNAIHRYPLYLADRFPLVAN